MPAVVSHGYHARSGREEAKIKRAVQHSSHYQILLPAISPAISSTTKMTMAMKNKILAISADAEAMPPKPNIAAMIETTRKNKANRNMVFSVPTAKKPQPKTQITAGCSAFMLTGG
jgi:hypothetical protein